MCQNGVQGKVKEKDKGVLISKCISRGDLCFWENGYNLLCCLFPNLADPQVYSSVA